MKSKKKTSLLQALLFTLLGVMTISLARASTVSLNFDSDPIGGGVITPHSSGDSGTLANLAGTWISTNGSTLELGVGDQSTNGYWAITQTTPTNAYTQHGMKSEMVFTEIDSGLAEAGFTFAADVRIGGGTVTPADGFSVSFARNGDATMNTASETGTGTGLSVCFLAYNGDSATGARGLQINVDGKAVTNVPLATLNGVCGDTTSLQTGPTDATGVQTSPNLLAGLCWQPVWINFSPSGLLNVSYKGVPLITNYAVPVALAAGKFVVAGRTGGLWQEQDIDNLTITTIPSTTPLVGTMATTISSWLFNIYDSGIATPDTNTLTVTIDGSLVTLTAIKQSGSIGNVNGSGVTTVFYRGLTQLFVPGSLHTNVVHFTGSPSFAGAVNKTNTFRVATPTGAVARIGGYSANFRGAPQYSPNSGGHTGLPGDYAMDFVQAGTNNCLIANEPVFAAFLQNTIKADVMSVSFWEKRRSLPGGVPSVYWFFSPGESQGCGWQMHCPYANENCYFDTGGTGTGQRINLGFNSSTLPGFVDDSYWTNASGGGTWHHIVAIKDHTVKQVWIDGFLFLTNAAAQPQAALLTDMNLLYIGGAIGNNTSINGLLDDFAIYTTALSGLDVTNLFTGTAPDAIGSAASLLALWDFNDATPTISITRAGHNAVITYSQTLQFSTNLLTGFVDVPGATNPYTNNMTTNPAVFFRARK